jgi:hypothetical protein
VSRIKYGSATKRRGVCPDCSGPMHCKSERCYKCQRPHGHPDPKTYILGKVVKEDRGHASPCWLWQGDLTESGYGKGVNRLLGGNFRVHRGAYETFVGPIPEGHEIDHLCYVRNCCNPEHLEAVTPEQNKARMIERRGLSQNPKSAYMREWRKRRASSGGVFVALALIAANTFVVLHG